MFNTYISFYLNSNKIHVFIEALRGIGSPKRICFMIDEKGNRFLMMPHTKKDFTSHNVPQAVYRGLDSLEVNSKKLCRLLAAQHHWDVSRSYRAPGIIIPDKHLAAFDLSLAERITKQ